MMEAIQYILGLDVQANMKSPAVKTIDPIIIIGNFDSGVGLTMGRVALLMAFLTMEYLTTNKRTARSIPQSRPRNGKVATTGCHRR